MSNQDSIIKLFPQPLFKYKLENFEKHNKELIPYIYELQKKDKIGENRSNAGGWHSKAFDLKDTGSVQHKFFLETGKYVQDVFKKYGWVFDPKKVRYREMWAIINKKNDFNTEHTHPNSFLSAAYYAKAPKNCGKFIVVNPNNINRHFFPTLEGQTDLNQTRRGMEIEEGDLLIFPGHLPHKVDKNESNEDRIVISFNVDVAS